MNIEGSGRLTPEFQKAAEGRYCRSGLEALNARCLNLWRWTLSCHGDSRLQYISDTRTMGSSTKESYRQGVGPALQELSVPWAAEMEGWDFSSTLDSRWLYYKSQILDMEQQDLLFSLLGFRPDFSFQEWECLLYAIMYWNHVTCFSVLRDITIKRLFQMKLGLWILKQCLNCWSLGIFGVVPNFALWNGHQLMGTSEEKLLLNSDNHVRLQGDANIVSLTGSGITW